MSDEMVSIGIRDLIELTSSEIARKVTDKLQTDHIEPIYNRLREIELKLAVPSTTTQSNNLVIARWRGALDAAWKIGVIGFAIIEAWHYIHS